MRLKRAFFLMLKRWPFWQRFGMWDFLYGEVVFSQVSTSRAEFLQSLSAKVGFSEVRDAKVEFLEVQT